MNNSLVHIAVGVVLAGLLLTLAGLLPFWAPMMNQMFGLLVVSILMVVWAGFVLKEQVHDEREMQLSMRSGKVGYLSGLVVLTFALVFQGLHHAIDPWICVALTVMVISKIATRTYLE